MRVLLALVIAGLATGATPLPARAQQGVTDAEILLGGSNSFSGPLAFTGEQATRFGVDLYFKAVNDGGGIHGGRCGRCTTTTATSRRRRSPTRGSSSSRME